MQISVPTSLGELLDKIAILEIKAERIVDPAKRANVETELTELNATYAGIPELNADARARLADPIARLKAVNQRLWDIEDDIRLCEKAGDFGQRFIVLARSVYKENDERARVKREINVAFGSRLVEEKSYA
ncbi:MAG: DUF6165 family protein [Hyphomonadaceae bacterium]